jgi:TonB family protein
MILLAYIALVLVVWFTPSVTAQSSGRSSRIAVLEFGNSTAQRVTDTITRALREGAGSEQIQIVDQDLARVAAKGVGYAGSLNLTIQDARDLGAAIGCDFYLLGDAQILRRSPSSGPAYFEAYASVFLVSTRTGKLISWERPSFEAATPEAAEQLLLSQISNAGTRRRYLLVLQRAQEDERSQRQVAVDRNTPVIEEAPQEAGEQANLRLPRPYRRLRPAYPDMAARADAEGTVDVLVDLDTEGEVNRIEVTRWAGFGLDEATVNTVRQLHFFPALRDGVAIPIRVLLRYNFRKPAR